MAEIFLHTTRTYPSSIQGEPPSIDRMIIFINGIILVLTNILKLVTLLVLKSTIVDKLKPFPINYHIIQLLIVWLVS